MLDEERPHGSTVTVSGLVTSAQRKITKRGDSWATITLEDLDGGRLRLGGGVGDEVGADALGARVERIGPRRLRRPERRLGRDNGD